jgi:hypothetical protein
MTIRSTSRRRLAALAAASVAMTAVAGCNLIQSAPGAVDTATILGDFTDRLSNASRLTYTADYGVPGGDPVTVVRQPPNTAIVGAQGRLIVTETHVVRCTTAAGTTTCHRAPSPDPDPDPETGTAAPGPASAGVVASVTGARFVTREEALGLIAVAAAAPGAKADVTERDIAGLASLCADVTGPKASAAPAGAQAAGDFSVCVTGQGVLASFRWTFDTGERRAVVLTSLRNVADPQVFTIPAGARIVDVATLPR